MLQIDNYHWVTEKLPANDEQEIFRRQDWAHRFLLFPVASRHETIFQLAAMSHCLNKASVAT